jgi:hypothetical protein
MSGNSTHFGKNMPTHFKLEKREHLVSESMTHADLEHMLQPFISMGADTQLSGGSTLTPHESTMMDRYTYTSSYYPYIGKLPAFPSYSAIEPSTSLDTVLSPFSTYTTIRPNAHPTLGVPLTSPSNSETSGIPDVPETPETPDTLETSETQGTLEVETIRSVTMRDDSTIRLDVADTAASQVHVSYSQVSSKFTTKLHPSLLR